MNSKTAQLNELIEIIRDGQRFYEHAHDEVKDIRLQALFRDMARVKAELIAALAAKVAANQGEPASGGTLLGKLRQVYADTRATLARDGEAAYVVQLEEAEDRILQAFEDALESTADDVRVLLVVEMAKVRVCHERMRELRLEMR